ncbi:MAG: AmmeMemoRadiSam system radical SAM enzyme [Chloroflexi bacterium]|nr:AmmeMemoRadiSam system radical SAM enzyme [Chloroflexota bacterium]
MARKPGDRKIESVVKDVDLEPVHDQEAQVLEQLGTLREALIYEKLGEARARCGICLRRCNIAEGRAGYCQTIINRGGVLYTTIYGVVSSAHADPIEKKPVYHYKPGSLVYSLGSFGCNFRCVFCQNWEIAYADGTSLEGVCQPNMMPEGAVKLAIEESCHGLAWTYNEPGIWLNYTLDCARLAKKAGLYTVYVTNGYATPEHLDTIGPYLDVYRVDLKSMSDHFYQKLIKVPHVADILEVTKRAKDKWHMHLEAVTNVIPTWNDDEENLTKLARWVRDNLGELTPWHITRFFPYARLTNVPPTPIATLERARRIGLEQGLKFVYLGNVNLPDGSDTYCPGCGALSIKRKGYSVSIVTEMKDGRCVKCGADLNIVL